MATDFFILRKGLKRLAILLFFLIASPILLSMSFKALAIYHEGVKYWFSIAFLVISSLLMLFTIFYAFKTFRILLSSLFNEK